MDQYVLYKANEMNHLTTILKYILSYDRAIVERSYHQFEELYRSDLKILISYVEWIIIQWFNYKCLPKANLFHLIKKYKTIMFLVSPALLLFFIGRL